MRISDWSSDVCSSDLPTALLTRDMRFDLLALRSVLGLSVGGAVGIGMALDGFGAWSLVGQQLTQQAIIAAVLWSTGRWRPGPGFRSEERRVGKGGGSTWNFRGSPDH